MACCILAAFLIGHCALAWRWLKTRCGGGTHAPAALWSAAAAAATATPAQESRRSRQRPVLAWVAGLGVAALTIAAALAAAGGVGTRLPQGIAPSALWCFGDVHE